jgi:uncharacterized membrane protein
LTAAALARASADPPVWSHMMYLAASRLCHQRPERTFQTGGISWPVCGRCSGLYLAAPAGAAVGLIRRRRRSVADPDPSDLPWRLWLGAAALPTAATMLLEWSGVMGVTNLARAIAALPLGFAVAWALIAVLPVSEANQVH